MNNVHDLPAGARMHTEDLPVHELRAVELMDERVANMTVKDSGPHPYPFGSATGSVYMREITAMVCARKGDVLLIPSTWWDSLVAAHFPAWWRKRWPPQMTAYHARAYLPEIALPQGQRYGRVIWMDEDQRRMAEGGP